MMDHLNLMAQLAYHLTPVLVILMDSVHVNQDIQETNVMNVRQVIMM